MKEIVGVLLAAGNSRRFGAHKLLHPLITGEPIGIAAAHNLSSAIPNSLAVIRSGDLDLAKRYTDLGLRVIETPQADGGMGLSLAIGVTAAAAANGWLIALADMPWIKPNTISALADSLLCGASLVAPVHTGRRGHPVGFSAKWRAQLMALSGDQGARALLAAHTPELLLLPTEDAGVLLDIDLRMDLERN